MVNHRFQNMVTRFSKCNVNKWNGKMSRLLTKHSCTTTKKTIVYKVKGLQKKMTIRHQERRFSDILQFAKYITFEILITIKIA